MKQSNIPAVGEVYMDLDIGNATEILEGEPGDRSRNATNQRRIVVVRRREVVTPGIGVAGMRFEVENVVTNRRTSVTGGAFLVTSSRRGFVLVGP